MCIRDRRKCSSGNSPVNKISICVNSKTFKTQTRGYEMNTAPRPKPDEVSTTIVYNDLHYLLHTEIDFPLYTSL